MRSLLILFAFLLIISGCKKQDSSFFDSNNHVEFAEHLRITAFEAGYVVQVIHPWPGNEQQYTWVLHRANAQIHDTLSAFPRIQIPIQKIVVTSTTHIPALEMLGKIEHLVGFPNTNYISSTHVRKQIEQGLIQDLGNGAALNTELLMKLKPDVIVNFGVDKEHTAHKTLEKLKIITLYNADWVETSPLGRAEWLLLFGCLFDEFELANEKFDEIKKKYNSTRTLAALNSKRPSVMSGSPYEGKWYVPQGESWASQLIQDAGGNYIWKSLEGNGSAMLSVEDVVISAQKADFWIAPGQFYAYKQLAKADPMIQHLEAYKNQKIYTFSLKKGKTGGVIYYEEASARPDKVLEDMVKILHPNTLPKTPLHYFEPLIK